MRGARRRWTALRCGLIALAGAGLALGCDAGERPHAWFVTFADEGTRDAAVSVRARVREGGCDGDVIFATTIDREAPGMSPPVFAPGTYGVEASATDDACGVIAFGCVEVVLPLDPPTLEVELTTVSGPACDGSCSDGLCLPCPAGGCVSPMDAGVDGGVGGRDAGSGEDAGPPDAGASDAGPEEDAGPPDAGGPAAPTVVAPWSGVRTGSALAVEGSEGPMEHPLRPLVEWDEVAGAGGYRLEFAPCSGAAVSTCDFGAPERVALDLPASARTARPAAALGVETTTPPLGGRWGFRVGACLDDGGSGCIFSTPRYLDVGRTRGDLDGDGTADLLLVYEPNTGDATVRRMTGLSGSATTMVRVEAGLRRIAWVGDVDADGFEEYALATADTVRLLDVDGELGGFAADTRLLVAAGDVDADGYADFALQAGAEVWVQLGGPSSDPSRRLVIPSPGGVTEHGQRISRAGDQDGDGIEDLAVMSRVSADTVQVALFSLAGRVATPIGAPELIGTGEAGATSGFPIELVGGADIDGDGRADLAVLRRLSDTLTVLFGGRRENVSGFGINLEGALAMGSLDGTRRARVVIGAAESVSGFGETGATWHVRYSGDPFSVTQLSFFNEDRFGARVSVGDLDGDGFEDIVSLAGTGALMHLGRFSAGSVGGGGSFVFLPGGGRATEISR